jgi:hypothetical protein
MILPTSFVEIYEVVPQPHSPIGLWDYHGVRLPHDVQHLSYHLGLLELPDFLDDEVLTVLCLAANLLLNGACFRAHR